MLVVLQISDVFAPQFLLVDWRWEIFDECPKWNSLSLELLSKTSIVGTFVCGFSHFDVAREAKVSHSVGPKAMWKAGLPEQCPDAVNNLFHLSFSNTVGFWSSRRGGIVVNF